MGVHCYLIPIDERRLMNLDEARVPGLFDQARQRRIDSLDQIWLYEQLYQAHGEPMAALDPEKSWWFPLVFLTGQDFNDLAKVSRTNPIVASILGGQPIGPESQEGPARYLWNHEVRVIAAAAALASQTRAALLERYRDPAAR